MKRLLIVLAALAALGLGAVAIGGAVTSAQEGDGAVGTFLSKVAEKLDVSEDELKTAIQDTRVEMIDEAVAEGRLTEAQGERLKERADEGGFLFPPRHGEGRFRGHCQRAAGLILEASAEVLDMPKDDLAQQMKDGKSLAEVAEAQGMSVDDFKAGLLEKEKAKLDALVSDGKLTQDRADRIFQAFEDHIDRIVDAHPGDGGGCFGGPMHSPDDTGGSPDEDTGA
ncbi:MAG: hypothetical protein Q7R32_11135 [Dehalococcoidia bacterium]|nr:hypothetical protein [Dehalococcoidia bacterium]